MEAQTLFGRLASDKKEIIAPVLGEQVKRAVVKGKKTSQRPAAGRCASRRAQSPGARLLEWDAVEEVVG